MDHYKIIELYNSGKSIAQISKIYVISKWAISKILRDNNIQIRTSKEQIIFQSKHIDTDKIIELYNSGNSTYKIAKILNISDETARRKLIDNGIELRSHRENNINKTAHVNFEISSHSGSYWLGFLAADGHRTKNRNRLTIALQYRDRDHLYKLKSFMNSTANITYPKFKGKLTGITYFKSRICIEAYNAYNTLNDINKFRNNCDIEIANIKEFIHGYFDGDGIFSVTNKSNGQIRFTLDIITQNECQTNWFINKLNELGIKSKRAKYDNQKIEFVRISRSSYNRFIELIDEHGLSRKYDRKLEMVAVGEFKQQVTSYANGPIPDTWKYPAWTDDELNDDLSSITNWRPDGRITNIRHNALGTKVIKHFNHNFWHSHPDGAKSVVDAWPNEYAKHIKYLSSEKTFYNLLRQIKFGTKFRYPSLMTPQLSLNVITKYCPNGSSIYDPCAGWGSRFLSTLGRDYSYSCAEPNPYTRAGLRLIASFVKSKIKLLDRKVEDLVPPRISATHIWTSPSFGSEKYNGGPSIDSDNAVKYILTIAYYLLPIDGGVILHLPDHSTPFQSDSQMLINDSYGGVIHNWSMRTIKSKFRPLL